MSPKKKYNVKGNDVYMVFPGVREMISEAYLKGLRDGRAEALSMAHHAIATESLEQMKKLKFMLDCDPAEAEFPCQDYLSQEGEG